MGGGFGSPNLHGAVAHLDDKGKKHMTPFGSYPNRAVIIDGVFMAIKRKVFQKIRFDESCPSKWHFYDLDYSMQCHKGWIQSRCRRYFSNAQLSWSRIF